MKTSLKTRILNLKTHILSRLSTVQTRQKSARPRNVQKVHEQAKPVFNDVCTRSDAQKRQKSASTGNVQCVNEPCEPVFNDVCTRSDAQYGKNAFNSLNFTLQKPPPAHSRSRIQVGQSTRLLGFQRPGLAICSSALAQYQPEEYKNAQGKDDSGWNEHSLTVGSADTWFSILYYYLYACGMVMVFIAPPLAVITSILLVIIVAKWVDLIDLWIAFGLYAWLPSFVIWLSYKMFIWGIIDPKWMMLRPRRVFSLQRTTGMVQLFDKNDQLTFEAPFIEFDALLSTVYNQYGIAHYNLDLVHRYSTSYQGLSLGGAIAQNTHPEEHLRLWCMIQRYMDTSQSMPDILPLEAGRPHDPVTIAYDRERGRPERFWRDLSQDEYKRLLHKGRYISPIRHDLGDDINLFDNYSPAEAAQKAAAKAQAARDAEVNAAIEAAEEYARKQKNRNTPW